MENKKFIYDLKLDQLQEILAEWGEPKFRAKQIWQGLYQNLWQKPEEFSNISKELQIKLEAAFDFSHLDPSISVQSEDGQTQKVLFKIPGDLAIETVLMEYDKRRTVCISTQAGCGLACVFCATGQMGFKRNLSPGEITEQVLYFANKLKEKGEKVTNVVVMGMGEPFSNYDSTMAAMDLLNHSEGFNFGARRITISTVGLVPAINKFAEEKRQINLAISLHGANDALRSSMLPINERYPIESLIKACHDYVELTNRRVTFEWALIQGTNDSAKNAHQLGRLLEGLLCHVNIIPLNPTKGYEGKRSTKESVMKFKEILEEYEIPCTVRIRRGIDINAGCGQLANQN